MNTSSENSEDWTEKYSKRFNRPFWKNKSTGEKSWYPPQEDNRKVLKEGAQEKKRELREGRGNGKHVDLNIEYDQIDRPHGQSMILKADNPNVSPSLNLNPNSNSHHTSSTRRSNYKNHTEIGNDVNSHYPSSVESKGVGKGTGTEKLSSKAPPVKNATYNPTPYPKITHSNASNPTYNPSPSPNITHSNTNSNSNSNAKRSNNNSFNINKTDNDQADSARWEVKYSRKSGKKYWRDRATGKTSWRPLTTAEENEVLTYVPGSSAYLPPPPPPLSDLSYVPQPVQTSFIAPPSVLRLYVPPPPVITSYIPPPPPPVLRPYVPPPPLPYRPLPYSPLVSKAPYVLPPPQSSTSYEPRPPLEITSIMSPLPPKTVLTYVSPRPPSQLPRPEFISLEPSLQRESASEASLSPPITSETILAPNPNPNPDLESIEKIVPTNPSDSSKDMLLSLNTNTNPDTSPDTNPNTNPNINLNPSASLVKEADVCVKKERGKLNIPSDTSSPNLSSRRTEVPVPNPNSNPNPDPNTKKERRRLNMDLPVPWEIASNDSSVNPLWNAILTYHLG